MVMIVFTLYDVCGMLIPVRFFAFTDAHLTTYPQVSFPPDTHIVSSVPLLEWALGDGWAWPTKDKWGEGDDIYAACDLAVEFGGGCIAVMQRARTDGCDWRGR
mgnify:CR=1 FL=1